MKFTAQVTVMPLKELLDPQGKAVMTGLGNLGLRDVDDVRVGKNISLRIEAASKEEAQKIAEEASRKIQAKTVMEYYEITVLA
jgi:phosphoribosylformylglycinamidine synthase